MILLGTLSAVPAVTSGLYALSDVAGHGSVADSWTELKAGSNFSETDWRFVKYHIILNSAATGVALVAVVIWLGATDFWQEILRVPVLFMLIVALALMMDGAVAWRRNGVSARIRRAGKTKRDAGQPVSAVGMRDNIEYYAPEGEVHLLMAGLVFALAAAALGLSIRRAVMNDSVLVQRIPPRTFQRPRRGAEQADITVASAERSG